MKEIVNKIPCEVIQDILPLYHDRICSDKSSILVETHLKTCHPCREMLKSLDESVIEKEFRLETEGVLKHHAKQEKTLAVKTGIFIAGILILPVIIAIILTLPGYSDWKTNSVLLASMLLVAGMTVVPLVSKKKKFSKAIIFSTIALLLVIFFVEMFFDNGGILLFGQIALSVVFGISIPFFPFVIRQAELPETLSNQKGLLTMSWDTIWFYLMIFSFAVEYPASIRDLILVSSFFMTAGWLIFFVVRYIKTNGWIKSGIIVVISGVWAAIGNALNWIEIMGWDVHMEILTGSVLCGSLLVGIGMFTRRKS